MVFLGMLGDVLQGLQDARGNFRRDRQMLTPRPETVFVGDIAQVDGVAVRVGIAEESLNAYSVLANGNLGELALLLHLDAVPGLVIIAVRAVRIRSILV